MADVKRVFRIEAETNSGSYWQTYDDDIGSMAEGNERLLFLKEDQPQRAFRLIEVINQTEDV